MIEKDLLTVLSYPDLGLSFTLVYLEESIQTITSMRAYSDSEKKALNTLLVSSALMSSFLPHERELTLQARNLPDMGPLVAKCRPDGSLRGLLSPPKGPRTSSNTDHVTQVGLTYFTHQSGIATQSLISLHNKDISTTTACYLEHRATLPVWVFVDATDSRGVGIILRQESATENEACSQLIIQFDQIPKSDWLLYPNRAHQLIADVSNQSPELILNRNFEFACHCDREKMFEAIRLMGEEEAMDILDHNAFIEVTCHYCQKQRNFTKQEVSTLFNDPNCGTLH